jgi:chemotaxis protein CheZ
MPMQRRLFRIERMNPIATPAAVGAGDSPAGDQHQEILAELKALRERIEHRPERDASAVAPAAIQALREETGRIRRVLDCTRQEIAALRAGAFSGPGSPRVTRELDAVAEGSERAARQILDAAEHIEDAAGTLAAISKRKQQQEIAQNIQDQVIRIVEACNFQDLGGQRISKVLATLAFVEERIARMMEIWGSDAAATDRPAAGGAPSKVELMQGPRLDGDPGHATQADIDTLFAVG